ncbi:MAG: 2-oxoacid:ferredoxin oxidoreductase subunit beta [Acidobacteria bacterium]|nr:2-oxoacid:ferredoxin oxidoreductase subunit beta [Acidobacteriota bacterium]MBI3656203.1 2-oxoacid:ferredoxin oxidoreductase subunit beta [Acidobacteriota bacterium]
MATTGTMPPKAVNRLGFTMADYRGQESTLCAGCGHDAITSQIIKAFWEYGVEPHRVAKMSGIGCSSKTTAYFVNQGHGFNAVHGRMPAIATGAMLANQHLIGIGVSGDGDTASIGLGQFCHLLRRNLPIIYVIENNGVYGLTKGQFSATADLGSKLKTGVVNDLPSIDCCQLAIELGATYVARSFAGDPKQLVTLLKGALAHRGTCVIDVVSPCVTFNNHEGSTKSYAFAKEHEELLNEVGFVPFFNSIHVDYDEGTTIQVDMHDGSHIYLRKLDREHNPLDRVGAMTLLEKTKDSGELLTGLIYIDPVKKDFLSLLNLVDAPLATLSMEKTRPSRQSLKEIMSELM